MSNEYKYFGHNINTIPEIKQVASASSRVILQSSNRHRKYQDAGRHTAKAFSVQMPSRPRQHAASCDANVQSRYTPRFRSVAANLATSQGLQVHRQKTCPSISVSALICLCIAKLFQKLPPSRCSCHCDA